jgi:hypothetical protein
MPLVPLVVRLERMGGWQAALGRLPNQILAVQAVTPGTPLLEVLGLHPSSEVAAVAAAAGKTHLRLMPLVARVVNLVPHPLTQPQVAQAPESSTATQAAMLLLASRARGAAAAARTRRKAEQAARAVSRVAAEGVVVRPLTQVQQAQAAQEAVAWSS